MANKNPEPYIPFVYYNELQALHSVGRELEAEHPHFVSMLNRLLKAAAHATQVELPEGHIVLFGELSSEDLETQVAKLRYSLG